MAHTEYRTTVPCTAILVSANPLTSTQNVTHADQNLGSVFGLLIPEKKRTTCHRTSPIVQLQTLPLCLVHCLVTAQSYTTVVTLQTRAGPASLWQT